VTDGRLTFAGFGFDLPEGSPARGAQGKIVLGLRPTDFEHAASAAPGLPRVRVTPDVVEDLGSESHLIFRIEAPRVTAEAVRAATEQADEDEGKLFADDRAVFTAVVDARRAAAAGSEVELAIDSNRLHFFDPATGLSLAAVPAAAV
jgi:multiple sugar transport system ATP-binding protein